MSSSFSQFRVKYPDNQLSLFQQGTRLPYVHCVLEGANYPYTANDLCGWLGDSTDGYVVKEDTLSSFDQTTQLFTCPLDGYYEINASVFVTPATVNSFLYADIYPLDASGYSVDFAGGNYSGAPKNGVYTTRFLSKGSSLQIRIHSTSNLTIIGLQLNNVNARGMDRINTVFSIKYITPYVTDNIRITNLENV